MKVKTLVMIVILGLVYILQLCWVKLVVVFLHILESMSCDVQNLFLTVMLVPVVEETLYRHFPLSITKNYFPKSKFAVIFGSSIVFGMGHDNDFVGNILLQGCLGLSFALIYWKYGFKYSVLSHALWNLGCFLNLTP
jgi:membrane protease YdiL (CAAX protease family)